jgi:hypothetical protein
MSPSQCQGKEMLTGDEWAKGNPFAGSQLPTGVGADTAGS